MPLGRTAEDTHQHGNVRYDDHVLFGSDRAIRVEYERLLLLIADRPVAVKSDVDFLPRLSGMKGVTLMSLRLHFFLL